MVGHRRLIAEAMIVPFYFLRFTTLILFQAESPIFEEFQSGALFVMSWSAAEMVVQDAVQTYLFAEP